MRTHPIVCYRSPKSGPNPRKGYRYIHMRRRACVFARRHRDGALPSHPVCGVEARGRCRWDGSEKESFSSTRRALLAVVVVAVVDVRVAALDPRDAKPQSWKAIAVIVRVLRSDTRSWCVLRIPNRRDRRERKREKGGARAHLVHDTSRPLFTRVRRRGVSRLLHGNVLGSRKVIIPPCYRRRRRRRHRHHRRRRRGWWWC